MENVLFSGSVQVGDIQTAANVTIRFDERIGAVIGLREEPCVVRRGSLFIFALLWLFKLHPGLDRAFPPGALGLQINGTPPGDATTLENGDLIEFFVKA